MRPALAYASRGRLSEVSALAASAYLGAFALVAFVYSSPIVLAGAGAAVAAAGLAAGAGRSLALSLRWSAVLAVLIVAVNALASQLGETILVRGGELPVLGRIDVSAEALVEGGVLALRIAVVLAAFAVHSACVNPDRLLRLVRPLARHSALTATLIARLVPLAASDYGRLRDAAGLRGPAAAAVGRAATARRLVAGSLDRAVDVAASLELRGYGHGAPLRSGGERASRHSPRFAACGLAVAVLAVSARIAGAGGFDAYPALSIDADAATVALAAGLPALALLPFSGQRRSPLRRGRSPRPASSEVAGER